MLHLQNNVVITSKTYRLYIILILYICIIYLINNGYIPYNVLSVPKSSVYGAREIRSWVPFPEPVLSPNSAVSESFSEFGSLAPV